MGSLFAVISSQEVQTHCHWLAVLMVGFLAPEGFAKSLSDQQAAAWVSFVTKKQYSYGLILIIYSKFDFFFLARQTGLEGGASLSGGGSYIAPQATQKQLM
jgi:hypothetical protein